MVRGTWLSTPPSTDQQRSRQAANPSQSSVTTSLCRRTRSVCTSEAAATHHASLECGSSRSGRIRRYRPFCEPPRGHRPSGASQGPKPNTGSPVSDALSGDGGRMSGLRSFSRKRNIEDARNRKATPSRLAKAEMQRNPRRSAPARLLLRTCPRVGILQVATGGLRSLETSRRVNSITVLRSGTARHASIDRQRHFA